MIDINSSDFMKTFDLKKATIGIVGLGFVGHAISEFFRDKCNQFSNDKKIPESTPLVNIVENAEIIFICVPTPMRDDGSCYTGFVEDVIEDIWIAARERHRNLDRFIVVIKSTVYPGFLEDMQERYLPMRLVYSPEFLTEKNGDKDLAETNRFIFGGDEDDAIIVCKYFAEADPARLEDGRRVIMQTDPNVAEMVKLYANGMLAVKVAFSNEVYALCQKLGVDFEDVRMLAVLDQRIGPGHTLVPGPDGQLGFGGHCLPKDLNNLRAAFRKSGVPEQVLTAVIESNDAVREKKDWQDMEDRAVTKR